MAVGHPAAAVLWVPPHSGLFGLKRGNARNFRKHTNVAT